MEPSERDRRLAEFDRVHGLVNGKAQRRIGAVDIAGGILLAVFVLAIVVGIVYLLVN